MPETDPRTTLVGRLRAAGCVYAEEEADELLAAAAGADLEALVVRREAGEPLEVVVGHVRFDGLDLRIGAGVFVPRRRTELVVREAARLLLAAPERERVAVDLCCGAGAVAAGLLHRVPGLEVVAADADPAAVAWARTNLASADVRVGDLFAALDPGLRGRVRVLAVNAPYVPTGALATMPVDSREHEPRATLDGGADGLDFHRRVAAGAGDWLAPGGSVVMEVGEEQSARAVEVFGRHGYAARTVHDEQVGGCVVIADSAPAQAPPRLAP